MEKVFKCLKTFAIWNDCVKRCNVYGENQFVLAGEIEIAERGRRLGDRFHEHLRDVGKNDKDASRSSFQSP